jgi:hypothetical protein
MMLFLYKSKKELKAAIGEKLRYRETSMFGDEYISDGNITGANRPHLTGIGREFFATVTLENNIIKKVK